MIFTRSTCLCIALLMVSMCGCGNDDSPDGLTKQLISKMNQLADAFEANESEQEIEVLQSDLAAIAKKMDALNLSDTEKADLEKRHQDAIKQARERMAKVLMSDLSGELSNTLPKTGEEQESTSKMNENKVEEMDNTLKGVGN